MEILVCVKQVPDTTEIKIDPVTNTLIRAGVPSIVNTFDAYALELALRYKEGYEKDAKVTVLSMGPEQAKEALKTCLAMGADEAYLVSGRKFGGSDTLATSYIITTAIKKVCELKGIEKFDIIFCGKQAIDGDTAQVGPEIAENMDLPQVTYVVDMEKSENGVKVKKETEAGFDMIEVGVPCLLTVTKPKFEPRYGTVRSRMMASRAQIPTITDDDLEGMIDFSKAGLKGSPTKVRKTFVPPRKQGGVKIKEETGAESVAKLLGMLTEAKVL